MSSTLSEKFSKIAARNIAGTARQTRKIVVVREHANKRTTQVNARRGIAPANRQTANGANKRPVAQNQAKGGRGGRGRGGRGGRGRGAPRSIAIFSFLMLGNNDRRNNKDKEPSKSQTDLDLEMDSCTFFRIIIFPLISADWFAAGKGPNPVVAALDKDMDNYFKDRVEKEEKEEIPPAPVANNV
jgi:hypothetical protein